MTEPFENRIQALAKELPYPPTPSVAGAVMSRIESTSTRPLLGRRLAWGLTILLVVFAGLMFVPPVRAAVLEFIQIGIVRIFSNAEPTLIPGTETPMPTPTQLPLIPILETLGGKTTLESARNIVDFPIPLPAYPADLGEPDYVFVQDAGGWMVILVWRDPQQPDEVQMSLHLIEQGSWTIDKYQPDTITETKVNGIRAIWTAGAYPLLLQNNDIEFRRLIEGHVLIWEINEITYRLETDLSLEEAIQIAESISP